MISLLHIHSDITVNVNYLIERNLTVVIAFTHSGGCAGIHAGSTAMRHALLISFRKAGCYRATLRHVGVTEMKRTRMVVRKKQGRSAIQ